MIKESLGNSSSDSEINDDRKHVFNSGVLTEHVSYDFSEKRMKKDQINYPLYVGDLIKKHYNDGKSSKKTLDVEYVVEVMLETFSP